MDGEDLRGEPYQRRFDCLAAWWLTCSLSSCIELVAPVLATKGKTELWEQLKRENREGIVFKKLNAPYMPGKPGRGGPQLKFKFVATLSAMVAKVNRQRSVELILFNGSRSVACGNVAIPANHDIPPVGAIVEVR